MSLSLKLVQIISAENALACECCGQEECDNTIAKHQDNLSEENIHQMSTETCQLLDDTTMNIAACQKLCRSKSLPINLGEHMNQTVFQTEGSGNQMACEPQIELMVAESTIQNLVKKRIDFFEERP